MSEVVQEEAWLERDKGERVAIRGNCSIGRSHANQVVLTNDRVSRRHATIHAQGESESCESCEYWLVDLGSSNGTYINGRRVSQPIELRNGDAIRIGPFHMVFHRRRGGADLSDDYTTSDRTVVDIKALPCWLLVADIEGSTKLAGELPAEQLAVLTGRWFSNSKEIIEGSGGTINKYLGDGFFAYWLAAQSSAKSVVKALEAIRPLQDQAQPPFRLVVHFGEVLMGGVASLGEESLSGSAVNFVFRMEKLASSLSALRLMSDPVHKQIETLMKSTSVGDHPLPAFPGQFAFHTF